MMNALEKVRFLKQEKERIGYSSPFLIDICCSIPSWQPGEIENVHKKFPYLPNAYVAYLKEFDSTSVAFCNFFGSQASDGISLAQKIVDHNHLLKDNYFAFAKDFGGSKFIFNKKGQVLRWDKYDYDFEEDPKLIAETFEEFVGDCLLGKRYSEFEFTENNNFYTLMQSQGWV